MPEWFHHITTEHYSTLVGWFYFIGAFLTLANKLIQCIRYEKTQGMPAKTAIFNWFFAPTRDNTVSWITTLGFVWLIGSMYINRWTVSILPSWVEGIPVRIPLAFFLGSIIEWLAPDVIKTIAKKVSSLITDKGETQSGEE